MSKPKKKASKALDDAARARIAAKRERKAAARSEREARRAEAATWRDPEAIAEREKHNAARLADEAGLVLVHGDERVAGIVATQGGYALVYRDGRRRSSTHTDVVEAMLLLCAQTTGPEDALRRQQDVANDWMTATKSTLDAEYRAGTLHWADEASFYDYFADDATKREMERSGYLD